MDTKSFFLNIGDMVKKKVSLPRISFYFIWKIIIKSCQHVIIKVCSITNKNDWHKSDTMNSDSLRESWI